MYTYCFMFQGVSVDCYIWKQMHIAISSEENTYSVVMGVHMHIHVAISEENTLCELRAGAFQFICIILF